MSDKLQNFSHTRNSYLRPSQRWQCGRTTPCAQGPDAQGRCSQSDLPCAPHATIRLKQRQMFLWLLCVGIALLTLFLNSSSILQRISPGPLSLGHAEVAGCQDCHAAAGQSLASWVKTAVLFSDHNDDQQCLSCHKLGENAFFPHSTTQTAFSEQGVDLEGDATSDANAQSIGWKYSMASAFRRWQQPEQQEVSCSVCHREHREEFSTHAEFDTQKCHTCHQNKFEKIEEAHPEYTNFPHAGPTRIQFDHASHLENYFYEDEFFDIAPEGCKQCHNPDQSGEWMLANSFEETCGTCHLDEILGGKRATEKGVAVLSIPEVDVDSLADAGLNIGEWPGWADGELTAFMRVLMPDSSLSLGELDPDITLDDLSQASPEELAAAAALVWEIKRLFYDLQIGGTRVIDQRLSPLFAGVLDKSTLNRMVAALPRDTLINNQQQWFPNLIEEMGRYSRSEVGVDKISDAVASDAQILEKRRASVSESEPDKRAESESSIFEEEADIFSDEEGAVFDEDSLFSDDDEDEDVFSEDELFSDDDDGLFDDDDGGLFDDEEEDDSSTPLGPESSLAPDVAMAVEPVSANDNESWALTGGWYRDGSSIRYRPTDHADLFFKTWLDVSSAQYGELDKALFDSLSAEQSVGNCVKCHSIEMTSAEGPSYRMHWQSFKPDNVTIDFNRFSHVSHFSLMTDDGCSSCHLINLDEANQALGESTVQWTSGFDNMQRSTCTQCHQQGRAPDSCLTCHNYHAEPQARQIDQIRDSLPNDRKGESL